MACAEGHVDDGAAAAGQRVDHAERGAPFDSLPGGPGRRSALKFWGATSSRKGRIGTPLFAAKRTQSDVVVMLLEEGTQSWRRRLDRHEGTAMISPRRTATTTGRRGRSCASGRQGNHRARRQGQEGAKRPREPRRAPGHMVTLESQRRELQAMVSAAAPLMERDVPTRMLPDADTPFYYSKNSWEAEQEIPGTPRRTPDEHCTPPCVHDNATSPQAPALMCCWTTSPRTDPSARRARLDRPGAAEESSSRSHGYRHFVRRPRRKKAIRRQ